MKLSLVRLPLLLILLVAPLVAAAYRHAPTGVTVPDGLTPFTRGDAQPYGQSTADSGVSFAFWGADATVTLYLRDGAERPGRTAASAVEESIQAFSKLPAFSEVKPRELPTTLERSGWKTAALTARLEDRPVITYVSCTMREGRIVKIRATTNRLENPKLEQLLNQLRDALDGTKQP